MSDTDEFALIAELFAPLAAGYPGALGLTDDAALIESRPGTSIVATTDAMVAGVHFFPDDPPGLIARKLVRTNLSDIAAMGARPFAMLLAAVFPRDATAEWLRAFAAGLAEDVKGYGVPLIGGDTVATTGPLTLALTALGRVEEGRALTRAQARPGDAIFVTGSIGDAGLGLKALRGELAAAPPDQAAALVDRYRLPRPRVELGPRLVGLAGAAIDVSDGLVADLGHICEVSGVGAEIRAATVPLSEAAAAAVARNPELLAFCLGAGDDYELLFTAPVADAPRVRQVAGECGVPVAEIGRITEASQGVRVIAADGGELTVRRAGYRHFGTA